MKIVIDYFTKLNQYDSKLRDDIISELSKKHTLYLLAPSFPKHFDNTVKIIKYHKGKFFNNSAYKKLENLQSSSIIAFDFLPNKITKNFNVVLYLESFLDVEQLKNLSKRKKYNLAKSLSFYKHFLTKTAYFKLYISNHLEIQKDKITVLEPRLDEKFFFENIDDDMRTIRRILYIYRIAKPYIFVFGHLKPNSNVENILKAFALVYQKLPDFKLVIASPDFKIGWDNKPTALTKRAEHILSLCESLKITRKVIFTGFIERKHLPVLVNNADLCINLSDNRQFSATLVESLGCGVPLIISDNPILKEISGNANMVVNQKSPENIAEAINNILHDEAKHDILSQKSKNRAGQFMKNHNAEIVSKVLRRIESEKSKKRLLFVNNEKIQKSQVDQFKQLVESHLDFIILKDEKWLDSFKQLKKLNKHLKKTASVLFANIVDIKQIIKIFLLKYINKKTKFYLNFTENYYINDFSKKAKKYQILHNFILSIFLKLAFDKYVVYDNLEKEYLIKKFKLNKKKFVKFNYYSTKPDLIKSEIVKRYKLKNYFVIAVETNSNFEINDFLEKILNKSNKVKILLITKKENNKNTKRLIQIEPKDKEQAIAVSKIYVNFNKSINFHDILYFMWFGVNYIGVENLYVKSLIYSGINGYILRKSQLDKIVEKISVLMRNPQQIKDIAKVNKHKANLFTLKNIQKNIKSEVSKL